MSLKVKQRRAARGGRGALRDSRHAVREGRGRGAGVRLGLRGLSRQNPVLFFLLKWEVVCGLFDFLV